MPEPILPSFPFDIRRMSHREIMIATGLTSGDEPSKDDQEFNFALIFVGKNAVEESIYRLKKKKTLKQLERNRKSRYYKDNDSNN